MTRHNKILVTLQFLIICVICWVIALFFFRDAGFFAINGTFQNFNPVRRLLNGQIPYKDFIDYLGLGHLYLGAGLTGILGRNYRASLLAFSFLSSFSFILTAYVLAKSILNNKNKGAALYIAGISFVLLTSIWYISGRIFHFYGSKSLVIRELFASIWCFIYVGNSARWIRALIISITAAVVMSTSSIIVRKIAYVRGGYKALIALFGAGILSGFAFTFSNDFGISCWVCMHFMTFIISLSHSRKFIQAALCTSLQFLISIAGIISAVYILTSGNFSNWLASISGTGSYQAWYYNSPKSYYIYNLDYPVLIAQGVPCLIYIIKIFIEHGNFKSINRYGIPAFVNMVSCCAANEYKIMSGGFLREPAVMILFITIVFEILYYINLNLNDRIHKYIFITIEAAFILLLTFAVSRRTFSDNYAYSSELGGMINKKIYQELKDAADFTNRGNIFATYASAQEVFNDTFQPSGTDYIIHVLGDKARTDYLDSFMNKNFKYAVTINPSYTQWEYWIQRANWFFYRELYRNWHKVYENSYEIYWERNNNIKTADIISGNININIVDIDSSTKKLQIQTLGNYDGIADVLLDYSIESTNDFSSKVMIRKCLQVQDREDKSGKLSFYTSNYLKDKSQEYIPVSIFDGQGEIILSSNPAENTLLKINSASCKVIFKFSTVSP